MTCVPKALLILEQNYMGAESYEIREEPMIKRDNVICKGIRRQYRAQLFFSLARYRQ